VTDRRLRIAIAALSTLGIGIAAYLVHAHYAGTAIACATGGCETVQQSRYAEIFGVPVALLGLFAFAGILATLLRSDTAGRAAAVTLSVSGVIFAAYLFVAQVAAIHAICQWCIASDVVLTVIAGLTLVRARRDPALGS
jgi:uncharacterized membrane protein